MFACAPTRAIDPHDHTPRSHRPHSPPPRRRFRLAGADVSASVAVFLIALPLSLGIALATGAPLQAGLVAAAVGGLVAGRLGGSPLQVSGPAAGLTVVTADLIQRYGWRTTCAITVLAGLAQLALGCLRVARTALAVSPAVVHGMLAGIGVTIAVAQLHIVLGGSPQSSVLDNLRALPAQLAGLHPGAVTVSALTLTLLLLWPRIPGRLGRLLRKIPAALVAVTGATAVAALASLTLPKVDLPSWSSHALAGLPEGPVLGIVAAVLTITLVCSVQSLLGAVAVDKMIAARQATTPVTGGGPAPLPPAPAPRVGRSDLDRELLGQGAANIVSGALGGLPVAGVAVRSSANVHAGAVSRNSTMLHGVLVVIAALLLVPVLELIPLAALAALVMAVGIQMVSLHHIRTVTRHREALVYAVTTLGVVFLGVLEGVLLGIAVAVAVALRRLARTRITHAEEGGVHHIHVRGQLTFLAVPRLSRTLHLVPQGAHAIIELDGSFMDHAAYESLQDWHKTHTAQGGTADLTGRRTPAAPTECHCRPWTPWRNHQCGSLMPVPHEVAGASGLGDESGVPPEDWRWAGGSVSGASGVGSGGSGPGGEASGPGGGSLRPGGEASGPGGGSLRPGGEASGPGGGSLRPGGEASGPGGGSLRPGGEASGPEGEASRPRRGASAPEGAASGSGGGASGPGDGGADQAGARARTGRTGAHAENGHPRTGPSTSTPAETSHSETGHSETGDENGSAERGHPGSDPTSTPTATSHSGSSPANTPAERGRPRTSPANTPTGTSHPGSSPANTPAEATRTGTACGPDQPQNPGTPPPAGATPTSSGRPEAPAATPPGTPASTAPTTPVPPPSAHQLARGISAFQRNTAPRVRGELARLAREGQRPAQLFLTCADSRLVTSMITSSGPGDLFVVRNVGNLVPMPGEESGDDSVAAAIEYAVDVLNVRSITVCGHSGCGAMQALLTTEPGGAQTPLKRWLRHGRPSLERMADDSRAWARLAGRAPADAVEQLCLTNVVQQLDHLRAHESVARALRTGALELHGMYFHVGEAQAYLLTEGVFDHVGTTDRPV
ncbi:SulP family inorganic anion transporter [Streptomyces niveiscabiei]|uniref:SulP family inorganic anion transporter n=2 Tax=Streptomyces niveiscabiei TaxID=164115 RepID=UPI0029A07F26|nr:SulP family inorganic anion transporter [Streptomyces niveiscabiei]MDX3387338.1 SulP family inorganic anion transporter [Streptomyces niveiscabiei]